MIEFLSFLVAILVLVTIHEWGHYWVAKRCGVAIEKFSIGFGKPLVSWKNKEGTEFCIAAIPLGGYVKMRGEYSIATQESQAEAQEGSFASRSVWQRMAIVAAGPLVNLIFAAVVFAFFQYGTVQTPAPVVAKPVAGSILAQTDLQDGDTLLAINQTPIHTYVEVKLKIVKQVMDQEPISIQWRDAMGNEHVSSPFPLNGLSVDQEDLEEKIGLELYQKDVVINQVVKDSPANHAGLQAGDILIGVNGNPATGNQIIRTIKNSPNEEISLMVQHQGVVSSVKLTPRAETLAANQPRAKPIVVGRSGIAFSNDVAMVTEHHGVFKAAYLGVTTTIEQGWLNLKGLYKIITGQLSLKNIGGPVTIAKQAGNSAQAGPAHFIWFLAVLSVILGTLNLLPIPVLDGGHLVYYAAEAIRGKPLPEQFLIAGQKIGFILLMLLMGIALFNDAHWFA